MKCFKIFSENFDINNFISIAAILISFLSIYYSKVHDDNVRFLDMFNEYYRKTFALRSDLDKITKSYWNIPFYYEYDSIIALEIGRAHV